MTRFWAAAAAIALGLTLSACAVGTVSTGAAGNAAAPAAASTPQTATWGDTYTWPDGIAVGMSPPKAVTASSEAAADGGPIRYAVRFAVEVINKSKSPFQYNPISMNGAVQFDGQQANEITDLEAKIGSEGPVTILPGQSTTFTVAYSLPAPHGTMQFEYDESIGTTAIFVGKV